MRDIRAVRAESVDVRKRAIATGGGSNSRRSAGTGSINEGVGRQTNTRICEGGRHDIDVQIVRSAVQQTLFLVHVVRRVAAADSGSIGSVGVVAAADAVLD